MFDKYLPVCRLLLIICLFAGYSANAQSPSSLNDCILYAQANNPQIRIAQLQITDADWRIKENKGTGFPQLSASISYQHFLQKPSVLFPNFLDLTSKVLTKGSFSLANNLGGNITYNQLLFNNSYLVGLKAARYYRDYVNDQMAVAKQSIRNSVTEAYLPALLISDNLSIIDKNIASLEKLFSDTKAINKAGFAEQLDVDRLELSLSSLRSQRATLARQQEIVINALKYTMSYPINQPLTLSDDVSKLMAQSGEADLTSQVNFQNRPEYGQLLRGQLLNEAQLEIYQKAWMPTVAGFAQYNPGFQWDKNYLNKFYFLPQAVAGLSVNIPIWDGGVTSAKKERASIAIQQVEEQKKMLESAITLEVDNARKQYLNAQERVVNQQKNLGLAQRIFETTQTKFKSGVGSSFEVVTAEQGMISAQQALNQAQFDLLAAKVAVKKALGN
jgi:outer membrane protein TolC